MLVQSGHTFDGNPAHLSPELYSANTVLARDDSASVSVDLTKHMPFAIAVAMMELLTLPSTHPLPSYPHQYFDSTTDRMDFDESHMEALPSASALEDAGYVLCKALSPWSASYCSCQNAAIVDPAVNALTRLWRVYETGARESPH